ncbi:MAG: DUF418 domain-containing protein [Actinobacteria bacterium]|nr:DUF418 domain-containing protein [Actinomycetota bacterium]
MNSQREAMPDRLRAIALLGIVVVNAPLLGIVGSAGLSPQSLAGPLNTAAAFLMIAFAQGKFYLLFSFLFGYSASFILKDNTRANRFRFSRRLLVLAVIGLAHAVFFFIGDILISYALLGFGLLALSRRSDRALKIWIVVTVTISILVITATVSLVALLPEPTTGLAYLDSALATGSFLEVAGARLESLPSVVIYVLLTQGGMAFAAFLLGLLASRQRFLADPQSRATQWRRMMIIGLSIGLPLQLVAAWLQVWSISAGSIYSEAGMAGLILGFATAPLLATGYVGLLGWILCRRPTFLQALTPAGRASLTVYIGESVLLSLLFCGYGLGFYGEWGSFPVMLAAVGSWGLLVLCARLWLNRFPRGPLEEVVARLTRRV